MKRMIAIVGTAVVATATFAGGTAFAATASWSGTVDSGGTTKVFDTQRTSSQLVQEKATTAPGDVGIALVGCTNITTISADQRHTAGGSYKTYSNSANKCFRHQIHRWNGADTNGWLPGNGVTDIAGSVVW
ncbi:hypothetical protein [Cellulomonas sp. P24]|uniref:hypothetical protein n=1 Tax=Cellulomonas sp. P24 TaxID=2885206 RepID=UPI00216B231E|nr:hypothetical protein [Cellulomonas sp. P24]MCR6492003.1 hypothetical protein [Cellulomonas sp. P24]